MAVVIPYFELHIRPMIRILDRDHMLAKDIDLWDFRSVRDRAGDIVRFLRVDPPRGMPTKASGGPWPGGWIQVFEEWIAAGFPRLGTTFGTYDARRIGDGRVLLRVAIELENGAMDAWVERRSLDPEVVEYDLLLRPAPAGVGEPPRTAQLKEVLSASVHSVFVTDATGRQEVPVST